MQVHRAQVGDQVMADEEGAAAQGAVNQRLDARKLFEAAGAGAWVRA